MLSASYDSAVIGISISARSLPLLPLGLAGPGPAANAASRSRMCGESGNNWDDWEGGRLIKMGRNRPQFFSRFSRFPASCWDNEPRNMTGIIPGSRGFLIRRKLSVKNFLVAIRRAESSRPVERRLFGMARKLWWSPFRHQLTFPPFSSSPDVTFAAKGYFDALVRMGELASESQGSKDLGE